MTLLDLSGREIARRIAARETSATEVMTAALDRIDAVNGKVNALVSLRPRDDLMAEAAAADRALEAGERAGPLHGLPIAVKDLANVAGLRTSMGSPITEGTVAQTDDLFAARMRDAGAIFIGKANAPEFGLGSHTFNPVFGATLNPYAPDRSAGGSSGGSGAALAARMQWLCDGSDAMGSLRNPAGWNNVYGFRPSWGRIPPDAAGDAVMHPLSTMGPMARDVGDLAYLLDVMAGPAPHAPYGPAPERFSGRIAAPVKGRRIAWGGDWGGAWPMEPGVMELCETAVATFSDLGCEVETIAPPFPAEDLWESWTVLRAFSVLGRVGPLYENPKTRAQLRDVAIWEVEQGLALTPQKILRASAIRSRWHAALARFFESYDALVLPTAQCFPFPVEQSHPTRIAGREMDTYHRWMEVMIPASLAGLPALGAPAGFSSEGLPMGLQIIGPYGGDLGVLQLGEAYHGATGWPDRSPPPL
ncbi:amidase [Pseudooceanicola nanhaiensis]|jgi:amidase|uniref:Amidase n=1 Tax=Pseudooceanicola nanhaiensis TaxID=375761 RepID=A0A917T2S3_9RHOB|nr:amidase [Pseudooceanicola nanhaiensis]GGM06267.1 amidase [Pseudooceanicola nanhaiensis]